MRRGRAAKRSPGALRVRKKGGKTARAIDALQKLQEFHRVVVAGHPVHAPAHVELDRASRRVGVNRDTHRSAVSQQIRPPKVSKGDWEGSASNVGHLLPDGHRIAEQQIRLALRQARLPNIGTRACVFQLASTRRCS
jgi:hypothetical protein